MRKLLPAPTGPGFDEPIDMTGYIPLTSIVKSKRRTSIRTVCQRLVKNESFMRMCTPDERRALINTAREGGDTRWFVLSVQAGVFSAESLKAAGYNA